MSNYTNLRNGIISAIRTNGNNEITGQLLQNELLAMITTLGYGYQFMGIANPDTVPGTPDAKVFYIAYTPGRYTNFGGITVTGLCVLKYATVWSREDIPVSGGGGGTEFAVEPTDLTLESGTPNKLKFADRLRESNITTGKNYIIVRESDTLASKLVTTNAIYEIRYDFDLSNNTIEIPANSILFFNGGKIKNATVVGADTCIIADNYLIFDNVTFSGTFKGDLNACWVGATPNNTSFDNSEILQDWFDGYSNVFRKLTFPLGTYYFLSSVALTSDKRNLTLSANGSTFNVNISTDDAYFITLSNSNASGSSGENFLFEDIRIVNIKKTSGVDLSKTRALYLDRAQRFNIQNVQFWYFDIAITLKDCWYGGINGLSFFYGNRIGISAIVGSSYELNTLEFDNVDFSGIARSVVEAVYPKESGETDEAYIMRTAACAFDAYTLLQGVSLRGCVFEGWDYGVRANWSRRSSSATVSGGTFSIDGCYFEANRQEDIYIGQGNYQNSGSGSNTLRFSHNVNIFGCRFHTLKHINIAGGNFVFINNEEIVVTIGRDESYISTNISYIGRITFDAYNSNNVGINKIGGTDYTKLYQVNGQQGAGYQSIKEIQFGKYSNLVHSRLGGYAFDTTSPGANPFVCAPWSLDIAPGTKYALDIKPYNFYYDKRNEYGRLFIPSGNSLLPVSVDQGRNFRAINCCDGIPLYEFIRRWKAGTSYTGKVHNLFPYVVTANPTAGTVYNESGTLVGFGINAIGTLSFPNNVYLDFIDALITIRISYSRNKVYADMLQCGRTYSELNRSVDEGYYDTAYLNAWGSNANMANVQKRINAIYYDTTNSKLMIYNGFAWVEMTTPYQRYYYQSFGAKLSERATIPDMVGQTFHNTATGITYTFTFGGGQHARSPRWISGIGLVDSLEHPNGYANDSTLDYANELSAGEKVVCNGRLYEWDGTGFKIPNTGNTAGRPTLTATDAGYMYFDTQLGKYICWDGTAWKNLDGSALS